jgi:hypothetical protein
MIQVDSISIKEFRGIRDLSLKLKNKNFAVCGRNGTGKSGVVDAIEFVLTGSVSRLTGEGRGDISLAEHGPHVDSRSDPDKALVTATLTAPSLKTSFTIERAVKSPNNFKVSTDDAEVLKVLKDIQAHPELVLSRREIIRYVLATPGNRAQEVQALLRIEPLGQVRANLQKIANAAEKAIGPMKSAALNARDSLLLALGITELSQEKLLVAANERRATLGLPALTEFTDTTSLRDGMATLAAAQTQRIPKAQATSDLVALRDALADLEGPQTQASVESVVGKIDVLVADPLAAAAVRREDFLKTGFELIEDESCPFCDLQWSSSALRAHVADKLAHLKGIAAKRAEIEKDIAPLIEKLRANQEAATMAAKYAKLAQPALSSENFDSFTASARDRVKALSALSRLDEVRAAVLSMPAVSKKVHESLDETLLHVSSLPEPSKQDAAKEWITIAQERLEVYRGARRSLKIGEDKASKARKIYEVYSQTSDAVLTGLYTAVQDDFVALYRFVNLDDEDKFEAKLLPSMGKLGFDVDFYGRGFFPPGAYHSEGHQDAMGLCLYLALMRRLHGSSFTLAVLDDVLMSIDAGHRREVCALLKKEFPSTQFVMTTHDPIWLRHMRTEGLTTSQAAIHFRSWTVDQGPTKWDDHDVWAEIASFLSSNDVRSAAALLRNYLEYVGGELCHRLRARVEYRGDAQYQLGELLPAAVKQFRSLFSKAKLAANSWGDKATLERLGSLEEEFGKLAKGSNVEEWQLNTAIHFNSWENLTREDFDPVVDAFRKLVGAFACGKCSETFRVSPERETAQYFGCRCGQNNFTLQGK